MAMSYAPFEPTRQEFIDRAIRRGDVRVPAEDGATRYRVIDRTHQKCEFTGSRDDCIAYVERAWWMAETAATAHGESAGQARAGALGFDKHIPGTGIWHRDRTLTDAMVSAHAGSDSS